MATTLPALTGTEKQIAWAEQIREAFLDKLTGERNAFAGAQARGVASGRTTNAAADAQITRMDALIAAISGQAAATWWIGHRAQTARELLKETMAATQA